MPIELYKHIFHQQTSDSHFIRYIPDEELKAVVDSYGLYLSAKGETQAMAFTDGWPVMAVMLDEPFRYEFNTGHKKETVHAGYLSGLFLEGTYITKAAEMKRLLVIRFTCEGLYHLLQQPLSALRGKTCWSLEELFGQEALGLLENIAKASSTAQQIQCVAYFLKRRIRPGLQGNAIFRQAVIRIRATKGEGNIQALARELNVTYKWLERKFQQYMGVSPKEYARLNRFLHAYFDLQATVGNDLMGTAIRHGFYDQNHFTKEFKQFTHQTPLAYLREKP